MNGEILVHQALRYGNPEKEQGRHFEIMADVKDKIKKCYSIKENRLSCAVQYLVVSKRQCNHFNARIWPLLIIMQENAFTLADEQ